MPFPFTFKLSVPGLSNPFSYPPLSPDAGAGVGGNANDIGNGSGNGSGSSSGTGRNDNMNNVCADLNSNGGFRLGRGTGIGQSLRPDTDILNQNLPSSSSSAFQQTYHYRRASPSPVRNSRKRGWEPSSSAEPYLGARTTLSSSSGYLDTPAKYREMANREQEQDGFQRVDRDDTPTPNHAATDQGQPPAKRRRGLAGSIVSTALSAALIGTAVGLTVYRLWRDRGKEPEKLLITPDGSATSVPSSPPPPPYSSSDPRSTSASGAGPNVNVIPPTPRGRRARAVHPHPSSSTRKRGTRVRGAHHKTHSISSFGPNAGLGSMVYPPTQPAFDFASSTAGSEAGYRASQSPSRDAAAFDDGGEGGVEEQMDWIGDKLKMLIEEGKKALGREVVVMSEVEEDEVDDGSGGWVDQDQEGMGVGQEKGRGSLSRSGSRKKLGMGMGSVGRRAGAGLGINPPPPYPMTSSSASSWREGFGSESLSASPRRAQFGGSPSASLVNVSMNGSGMTTPTRGGSEFPREDERSWESPEVRESMERARAKAREARERRAGFS